LVGPDRALIVLVNPLDTFDFPPKTLLSHAPVEKISQTIACMASHRAGRSRPSSCSIAPSRRAVLRLRLEGVWMHVGTPEAIAAAERAILASAA
jgi:hypothetical protein